MIFLLFPNIYHQSLCRWHQSVLFSQEYKKFVFKNANDKLEKISQWFKANKLSLNEGKTKFTLFTNHMITTTLH